MTIEMNHKSKIAAVWLTQAEENDPAIKIRLDALYSDCKEKKYTVAVFHSGSCDLARQTGDLLRYNRHRTAQRTGRGL